MNGAIVVARVIKPRTLYTVVGCLNMVVVAESVSRSSL